MLHRFFTSLAFATVCLAQCSQDTIRGSWVTFYQGTIMVPGESGSAPVATQVAHLIVAKIDYQGSLTGTGYAAIGGQPAAATTLAGTIQVNPDCYAASTFTVNVAGTRQLSGTGSDRLLILDNGNEMQAMSVKGWLGSQIGISSFRRMSVSSPQCTQDMPHGVYAGTFDGYWYEKGQSPGLPTSQVGMTTIGYGGRVSVAGTMALASNLYPNLYRVGYDGQIVVNEDCTATGRYSNGMVSYFVVLNYGEELLFLPLKFPTGAAIVIGHVKRISTLPVAPVW